MSLSGPDALRSLEEALRDVRREEDEIARRLARSAELITRMREQEGELKLVLNIPANQLQNARSFQDGQWPDLNSRSFQRDVDRYVASFPSSRSTSTGSSGAGESESRASGSAESEAVRQQEQPSQAR